LRSGLYIEALRSVRIVNDEQIRFAEIVGELAQSAKAFLDLRVPDEGGQQRALLPLVFPSEA
jgi:hypothetical protein